MKKALKNIAVIFVVTLLILATGGVSIYHHICHCAGEMSASVFMEASCHHENSAEEASCCHKAEMNACCAEKPVHNSEKACHDDDCCQTSLQFLKISDSFQTGIEKINLKPFQPITSLVIIEVAESAIQSSIFNIESFALPPPETGREILISLHQLKLDTHLV